MKKRGFFLITILAVSSILMTILGICLKYWVLEPLGIHREEPAIAIPFLVLADEKLSYRISAGYAQQSEPETAVQPETEENVSEPASATVSTEAASVPTTVPPTTVAPTTVPPTTVPPTEQVPTYVAVEESWFDDVLFIGDSRTVGLRDYARLGTADYFCAASMSVFTANAWPCSDEDFEEMLLEDVLKQEQYGKIYIHLGLNEVGYPVDEIIQKYSELLDLVQELQPDAAVILQEVMTVGRKKAEYPPFSLENIQNLNAAIESLAQERGLLFEYTNSWLADGEGYMPDGFSHDDCHPYGSGYLQWRSWILENAGWYQIP